LGGVQELESLKNSMTEMETVVKSMLKQKENISMEYDPLFGICITKTSSAGLGEILSSGFFLSAVLKGYAGLNFFQIRSR